MKDYCTPNIEICWIASNDLITASPISVADTTATGYEDGGDLTSVFNLG